MNICKLLPVIAVLLLCARIAQADWKLGDMLGKDDQGRVVYRPKPIDAKFKNPISDADELAFQQRARDVIAEQTKVKAAAGNTYFEGEKRSYGFLMAQVLAGSESAVRDLQLEDAQAQEWHRETAGIDFYACFTLKHQTRKFFYFGDLLAPEHRQRMVTGAKNWTAKDPFNRPHYSFEKPGEGWGPNVRNSWVDIRSTENLYFMRVTSVYLFAEASGNKEVATKYKDEIRRYTMTLYRIGMGEWDSENYHGHSMGALCNLYDFAQDDEVRLLAKACLDWIFAAGAVKYYRGAFNGPTKRDYNHAQPFGGSAANMLSLHFGDCPRKTGEFESDEVHLITSSYRPPAAVLHLARKNFDKPVELIASKPPYTATTSGDQFAKPEYAETQYFGRSYQMGSLKSGTSEDGGDVNGFKIVMFDGERGAVALQGVPGPDPKFVGSPAYQRGKVAGPNRVAQYGNLAIWLVKNGKAPWRWVLPQSIKVSQEKGVTFLEAERTWIALRPLGTTNIENDNALTEQISTGEKPAFPAHQVLAATGNAEQYCGVAIEVGEKETHGDFADFKRKVLAAEVDASKLNEAIVQYKAADAEGKWLGVHWNEKSGDLGVWRNGQRHDWKEHAKYIYATMPKKDASDSPAAKLSGPIFSRWGEGILYVEAGGEAFASAVDDAGHVSFANGKPSEVRAKFPALAKPFETSSRLEVPGLPSGVKIFKDLKAPKPGTHSYTVESDYQRGPVKLEVLLPTDYDASKRYRVLYTLPVNVGTRGPWGCALEEIQRRDLHNKHQMICVAPAFDIDPWLGDLPAAPASGQPWIRQQQYVVDIVLPCVEYLYSTERQASGRYLLGFSKSSLGALSIFLQHLDSFAAVGVFDNFDLEPSDKIFHDWGLVLSYGDREQFEKLNPQTLIPNAAKELKASGPRITVMTGSDDYAGVKQLRELLKQHDVPFKTKTLPDMPHDWRGQWLEEIVSSITEPHSP